MGQRGPTPMPDNVRALRGRTSHSKPPTQAVKAPPGRPTKPTWLDREAKAEWDRVVPMLDRLGVLSVIDRAILATYCSAWSFMRKAEAELQESGLTARGREGNPIKHPAWQVYREACTLVDTLAKSLYLTPVARLRVTKPEDDDGQTEGAGIID